MEANAWPLSTYSTCLQTERCLFGCMHGDDAHRGSSPSLTLLYSLSAVRISSSDVDARLGGLELYLYTCTSRNFDTIFGAPFFLFTAVSRVDPTKFINFHSK